MLNGKSSQASVEFLFTYGWVLLAVLISLSVLGYFGLLTPDRFSQEYCVAGDRLICSDALLISDADLQTGNGLMILRLYNAHERDITLLGATSEQWPLHNCTSFDLAAGASDEFSCYINPSALEGAKPLMKIVIQYIPSGQPNPVFSVPASLRRRVQAATNVQTCADQSLTHCQWPQKCPEGFLVQNFEPGDCCQISCLAAPQCSDGIDNDGDGCIDIGIDDDCTYPTQEIEGDTACYNSPLSAQPSLGTCESAGGICCMSSSTCLTAPIRTHYSDCQVNPLLPAEPNACCPTDDGNFCLSTG